MDPATCRLLYLDAYTVPDPKRGSRSSDSIGYGITASTAVRNGLRALGFSVESPTSEPPVGDERLSWNLSMYRSVLQAVTTDPPDLIFIFHIFAIFPVEIRRMVLDLRKSIPLVGYTHGSHWDPTDTFRFEAYPGMELLDLANFDALDRLLLVSEYMRTTLRDTIGAFNSAVADRIDAKAAVVGLPINTELIDAYRTDEDFPRTTVVFNHAPVLSKNPELFVRVLNRVLPRYDINVLFTRAFRVDQAGGKAIVDLAERFPDSVILGHDMSLDDYFRALWMADIQVSTASHESLGVSTLEAMYTENCCVLPRLGSYPEICGNHPEVLYELGEDSLEERLCYFLENPEKRRTVAAELRRCTAPYHPDAVVKKIANSLSEVVSGI
jgi:glycosyltransferase involved in cell wall biosynthesis